MTRSGPLAAGDGAVVLTAVMSVREEPAHRAQRVTEFVLGEVLGVLEREGEWVRAEGPDGYAGWVPAGPLEASARDPDAWAREAKLYSTGVAISTGGAIAPVASLARLPWGARVATAEGGVSLPDGTIAVPADADRLVLPLSADATGSAVAAAALEWLGVSYVWGGRTELGVDCSGFIQSVMARHGVALPRDSHRQRDAGPEVDLARPRNAGDLLFFAPEGRGVTHVALSLGEWRIAHAASTNGRVALDDLGGSSPLERRLRSSLVGATRPVTAEGG